MGFTKIKIFSTNIRKWFELIGEKEEDISTTKET